MSRYPRISTMQFAYHICLMKNTLRLFPVHSESKIPHSPNFHSPNSHSFDSHSFDSHSFDSHSLTPTPLTPLPPKQITTHQPSSLSRRHSNQYVQSKTLKSLFNLPTPHLQLPLPLPLSLAFARFSNSFRSASLSLSLSSSLSLALAFSCKALWIAIFRLHS